MMSAAKLKRAQVRAWWLILFAFSGIFALLARGEEILRTERLIRVGAPS